MQAQGQLDHLLKETEIVHPPLPLVASANLNTETPSTGIPITTLDE